MKNWNDPLKMKKIFLLAAVLAEEVKNQTAGSSLILQHVSRFTDSPWRPVEAWHFFILAQKQLQRGSLAAAMATAYKLQDYQDILDEEMIFSILALASAANKCYGVCSKAFTRLESLPNVNLSNQTIFLNNLYM